MAFQFQQGDRPLPGYTIERGVGRGGFGEVYYATSDGGKEVALKYLRENPQIELRGVAHCLNLKSPYLVDLHDVKQNADGDHFVVMEYVSGPSLRDLMNAEPDGLGPEKAAYFLRELGKGLSYLHDRGIVHRDLKPGNIFYEDGYVKIGDYGLAKIMAASQHSGQTVSVGTVHYMAPEVGSGNYDRTIDIYALGVLLYEMLLGRVPFSGATMGEVLMKHLTAQPEVDQLPEPFPGVIRKALAKDPKDRYQTVSEMLSDVFSVEGLDPSVSSIGAASLTTLAARVAAGARVTPAGPARGVGVALRDGSSNVGQDRPPPVINPAGAGPPRSLGHIHDRITERVGAVVDRIDRSQIGQQVAAAGQRSTRWAERVLIALLASAGISFGAGLLASGGEPTYAVAVFLHVLVVMGGVIIGSWLSFDRLAVEGKWLPRFIIGGCVGAGFVPISLFCVHVLGHGGVEQWIQPLLLAMILCDWPDRLRKGQRGQVCLGSAFSAGLFGLLAGIILAGDSGMTVAAILAAASLAAQSVAGIWPITGEAQGGRSAGQHRVPDGAGVAARGFAQPPPLVGGGPVVGIEGDARRQGQGAEAAVSDRVLRSGAARSLWLITSGLMTLTTAMLFIAAGLGDQGDKDFGLLIIAGIVAANYLLFTVSCAWPRYASGLWRGIFRKAVFFSGTATSGACGAAIGLLGPNGDELLALIGGIIAGGIVSLFVWFVPARPYVAQPASAPEPEDVRRIRRGRWLIRGGGILLGATSVLSMALIPILAKLGEAIVFAVVTPPIALALVLLVVGLVQSRRKKPEQTKLEMPLRCVFDVDANAKLSQLIERHFAVLGYDLDEKSDNLWSFDRGNWAGQFWQSNIRQWGTKLNIAAYQLDTGGHRLTCYLDIDSAFNSVSQKQIALLESELRDLKTLLGGRDSPSDASKGLA